MAGTTSTPKVLNNAIYLQSTEYNSTSHLDKAHLRHLNKGNDEITDMGIIEPFVTSGFMETPYLYGFDNIKVERKLVPGGKFKFSYPLHDEPCYIVEDLSLHSKPGIAGEKFKIKVNKRKYDNGYILAVDQHVQEQLLVTSDEIIEDGDGVILTVMYHGIDPANRYFPKDYLRPNTKLFAIGTVGGEYQKMYSSIPTFSGGIREYMQTVGESSTQLHYEVTRDAAFSKISGRTMAGLQDHRKIIEMYRFRPGSKGYDMSMKGESPRNLKRAYGSAYGANAGKQWKMDTVQKAWIPEIERLGMAYINAMCESKAIWGAGGQTSFDGKTKQNTAVGLFHQLNMGNQYNFNLDTFTIGELENIIYERLRGRVSPGDQFNIEIGVGVGMRTLLRNQLNQRLSSAGGVIQAQDITTGLGKNNNRHVQYNPIRVDSWEMLNGYGTITMKLIPGLDPIDALPTINPIVPVSKSGTAYRLSSYMIIIEDITSNDKSNIVEMVHGTDWDFTTRYIIGKLNYMGSNTSFVSSSHHPGYECFMEKKDKAYWVKDITKSLLIKPYNPLTGRPLYDGFFKG